MKMKRFLAIVTASVLWASVAFGQTWSDGYKGAEFLMRKFCSKESREPLTRQRCIDGQRIALESLKEGRPARLSEDAFELIRWRCEEDWPMDFTMRVECEEIQMKALDTLRGTHPVDISEGGFKAVRGNCTRKWPYDFKKRVECEDKELNDLRQLRQRKPNQ